VLILFIVEIHNKVCICVGVPIAIP
jgi:hypothetical protein